MTNALGLVRVVGAGSARSRRYKRRIHTAELVGDQLHVLCDGNAEHGWTTDIPAGLRPCRRCDTLVRPTTVALTVAPVHMPHAAAQGASRGPLHVDRAHRWWQSWDVDAVRRVVEHEHELGADVAWQLRRVVIPPPKPPPRTLLDLLDE